MPIFAHKPKSTDFLLVRETYVTSSGEVVDRFVIRELGNLYVAGQILPLKEVPAPNSREAIKMTNKRMHAAMYRLFRQQLKLVRGHSRPAPLCALVKFLAYLASAVSGRARASLAERSVDGLP